MIQKWNVALLRVRRLAHSLKRDTRSAVVHHPAGSPMSMTSPRTTLTCGHNAPLTLRPSAAPRPYFAITGATACFFGAICGTQGRLLRSQCTVTVRRSGHPGIVAIARSSGDGIFPFVWLFCACRRACVPVACPKRSIRWRQRYKPKILLTCWHPFPRISATGWLTAGGSTSNGKH